MPAPLHYGQNNPEFNHIVDHLLAHDAVQGLDEFAQHLNTSRLTHSLNVAYASYRLSKRLGLDYTSATRAGLLHDFYLYDWRKVKRPEGHHAAAHPQVALENAKSVTTLNSVEADAILKHMWPVTFALPRYPESAVVCCADKYCTCVEVKGQVLKAIKNRMGKLKCKLKKNRDNQRNEMYV